MGQRGRKSSAEIRVLGTKNKRPEPPAELNAAQAREWREIVHRLPPEWFPRETWPLLIQLCRHIAASKRIAQMIDQTLADYFELKDWDRLLRMQERQSSIIASLSTKLRISQQSSYDAKVAANSKAQRGECVNANDPAAEFLD